MAAEIRSLSGGVIVDKRGRNRDCMDSAVALINKAKCGEIVGFVAAVQYADGAAGEISGGYIRHAPVIGTLFCAAAKMATKD